MKNRKQKYFFLIVSIFTIFSLSYAEASKPGRIILNLTENPATEMAVTWRSCKKVDKPHAQITIANATPNLEESAQKIAATTEELILDKEKSVYHYSVVFKNLEPSTIYAYRVGDDENWSEWNHFETAANSPEAFEFVYLGDVQNGIYTMSSRVLRTAYKMAPKADFWFYAGDIVNQGDSDEEWQEFFDAVGWIARTTPMIFLPGNHEYPRKVLNGIKSRELNHIWRPQFTLPENGVPGLEETSYYIDYQGIRFITLNGNEKLEEQAEWLEKILKNNRQKWVIASIHQPFYSTAQGRDSKDRRDLFLPVFDKYNVDLVLQGHDHAYGRTYKMRHDKIVKDDEPGTYYVVSVVGTKVYDIKEENKKIMAKMGNGTQLFQVISVDNNKLSYKSYDATGKIFDKFEIEK